MLTLMPKSIFAQTSDTLVQKFSDFPLQFMVENHTEAIVDMHKQICKQTPDVHIAVLDSVFVLRPQTKRNTPVLQ